MAFRSDFSGLRGCPPVELDLPVRASDGESFRGDLLKDGLGVDGARSFEGRLEGDGVLEASGGVGSFCLVFGAGSAGKGPVGGLETCWVGWGNADEEAILAFRRLDRYQHARRIGSFSSSLQRSGVNPGN